MSESVAVKDQITCIQCWNTILQTYNDCFFLSLWSYIPIFYYKNTPILISLSQFTFVCIRCLTMQMLCIQHYNGMRCWIMCNFVIKHPLQKNKCIDWVFFSISKWSTIEFEISWTNWVWINPKQQNNECQLTCIYAPHWIAYETNKPA